MKTIGPFSEKELDSVAKQLLSEFHLLNIKVWRFDGEMGAGKTTLITHLMKFMQVKDHVSSPTFSIVNEYLSTQEGTIYHFDFYRIEDENEAFDIGTEEYLYSGNWCFLEWGERIENLLPEQLGKLQLTTTEDNNRIITIQHYG
jgi:tRNA threonylcarbamoyladenosine biosynthesis protein TsaE